MSEAQRTVVTETWGNLAGKRVVRGREEESRQFYAHQRHAAREAAAAGTREVEAVE